MSDPTPPSWYVHTDEKVFGPIPFSTLLHWAHTGSLNAESQLANTPEGPWESAEEHDELELNWQLEDPDGDRYCPCHILALRESLQTGDIAAEWPLHHLPTGDLTTVATALCSALLSLDRVQEQQLAEAHKQLAAQTTAPPSADAATPNAGDAELLEEWRSLKDERDSYAREAEKWQHLHQEEVERGKKREQDLQLKIDGLYAWQTKTGERVKALERRRSQLESVIEKARGTSSTELQQAYEELQGNFSLLTESLELRSREVDRARAGIKECEETLLREKIDMQKHLDAERETAASLLQQLHSTEESHTELIRSHRDLNARMIELRNQQAPPPSVSKPAPKSKKAGTDAESKTPKTEEDRPKPGSRKKRGKISLN